MQIHVYNINVLNLYNITFHSQDLLSRNVLSNVTAPKEVSLCTGIDRWSDCIGLDRDSCHLGTLSTILQHFTHNESSLWNPVAHIWLPISLPAAYGNEKLFSLGFWGGLFFLFLLGGGGSFVGGPQTCNSPIGRNINLQSIVVTAIHLVQGRNHRWAHISH